MKAGVRTPTSRPVELAVASALVLKGHRYWYMSAKSRHDTALDRPFYIRETRIDTLLLLA